MLAFAYAAVANSIVFVDFREIDSFFADVISFLHVSVADVEVRKLLLIESDLLFAQFYLFFLNYYIFLCFKFQKL